MPSVVLFCSDSSYQGLGSVIIRYMCIIIYEHMLISITMADLFPLLMKASYFVFYLDISEVIGQQHCMSPCVWVRSGIFSQLSIIQYVGLCVFSLPISLVMIDRMYILCLIIIIKSEVWTITHCLGLGHQTTVCAVCLSAFLFLFLRCNQLCIDTPWMSTAMTTIITATSQRAW